MSEPFYKRFWGMLNLNAKILFIITIVYFFYLANNTRPVPNFDTKTQTLKYTAQDYVPNNSVTFTQAIIGVLLVFSTLYLALISNVEQIGFVTREEATELIMKEFEIMKKQGIFSKNATLKLDIDSGGVVLRTFMTSEDKNLRPFRWVFGGTVEDNGLENFVRIYVNPIKPGYVIGFYKALEPLEGKDICPKCGQEYNVKLMVSPTITETRLLRDYFIKRQR